MASTDQRDHAGSRPATLPSRGKARPLRRILAAVLLVLLAGMLVVAWSARGLFEPNRYAAVRSIERDPAYRDPALMAAAWAMPVATRYRLAPYEFQHNQSFCSPTSVADVLHSLGDGRTQQAVIDGTRYQPWFGILLGGMTLDQLADLLRQRSGRPVTMMRDLTLAQFRQELLRVNDPGRRIIANFHRGPLFGRGHGHFSPLLAYLPTRHLVLVGDVNPQYRPFLVGSARLWQAVDTIDPATGRKRGLLMISAR